MPTIILTLLLLTKFSTFLFGIEFWSSSLHQALALLKKETSDAFFFSVSVCGHGPLDLIWMDDESVLSI